MAAPADPPPNQKDGLSTRAVKHSVLPVLACVAVIAWGHHRLELLLVLVFLAPLIIVQVGSMALVGACWGVAIERISIFYGGLLYRFNIGGIPIEVGYWPTGGSTTFRRADGDTTSSQGLRGYDQLRPWQRVVIILSGP